MLPSALSASDPDAAIAADGRKIPAASSDPEMHRPVHSFGRRIIRLKFRLSIGLRAGRAAMYSTSDVTVESSPELLLASPSCWFPAVSALVFPFPVKVLPSGSFIHRFRFGHPQTGILLLQFPLQTALLAVFPELPLIAQISSSAFRLISASV